MGMAQRYKKTPSEILRIDDEYTAYCLDEACAVIASRMDKGENPVFVTRYKSFTDLYASALNRGR